MKYADYYRQSIADLNRFGADDIDDDDPATKYRQITDQQIIDACAMGMGVRGYGDEAARRGLLDKIPGDNWG